MAKIQTAIVGRVMLKSDCVYIFPDEEYIDKIDYYIIASLKQAKKLKTGDNIEYLPYGVNFGIFVKKKRRSSLKRRSLSK